MINYVLMTLLMGLVIWLIGRFSLVGHCKTALTLTTQANKILLDKTLNDAQKEQQTQQMAKQLMAQFVRIALAGVGAFLLPLLPLYGLDYFGLIVLDTLFEQMLSLEALILLGGLSVLAYVLLNRKG